MKPADRISKARTELLLDHPWFGSLAMNLRMQENNTIPTFYVDGTTMRYNPEFAATLTNRELVGVIAHEVMHCLKAGTNVITDQGLKPIETINVGDNVWSGTNGNFTK